MKRKPVFFLLLLAPVMLAAASLPLDERVPGGVAVVPLPLTGGPMPKVEMDGRHIMVLSQDGRWYAVAGLPLDAAPGDKTLEMHVAGGEPLHVSFSVAAKEYPLQSLTIQNPEMVNPTPAEERRIVREQKHLDKVLGGWRRTSKPGVAFVWPADGPETSGFGLRRVLNGEPKSPHAGIDIGAPAGTVVRAPADAVVADVGHYYYCGKTLTLDLGQGLYSVYCHLSKIKVKPGERVKQGQYVGRIGATGRTTGPNLHWTVRLNGAAVDPHAFLGANVPAPKAVTVAAPAKTTAPAPVTTPVPQPATH